MHIILNLYIIISAMFLTTTHNVGLADKMIIATYIVLQIYIAYVLVSNLNRGARITIGLDSWIQFFLPTFLVVLYFINGFSLVFFNPPIRLF